MGRQGHQRTLWQKADPPLTTSPPTSRGGLERELRETYSPAVDHTSRAKQHINTQIQS